MKHKTVLSFGASNSRSSINVQLAQYAAKQLFDAEKGIIDPDLAQPLQDTLDILQSHLDSN